ncbi:hypothetical protein [Actinotalea sp. Marseille-Q4924]|uniref:hypothetical protein n=1 Tax=Actinotalea sp. Marseille-Q4924 TaxID=2866571 RepID=UPI001CE42808|nr:hypothetical protein [Actinotalea sp. Marseille-Q4924]
MRLRRLRRLATGLLAAVVAVATVGAGTAATPTAAAATASPREAALTAAPAAPVAAALTGALFDAGNLISDAVFWNSSTMDAPAVQRFLDAQQRTCASARGNPCLARYSTTTTAKPAEPGLCAGYTGGRVETAAQIIAGVSASCGINPRVLLVLLEKEQSLVTASSPTDTQYRSATGFGCPDGAPCDAQYYGFFNQVYSAARQFNWYALNPTRYAHRARQLNSIRYHPDIACGSGPVYIQNQATAGLYNYTPYQPNAAALANLYGTGDACSAYGNRNFWRIFTDWFGSTQTLGGYLLRTATDPTVYVVTTQNKYPVKDAATLAMLSALGPVGVVSQVYLDMRPTGGVMHKLIRGRDTMVYLVDGPHKYPFDSCTMVARYGYDCTQSQLLDDAQIAAFYTGPTLTNGVRTNSGRFYAVEWGSVLEAPDAATLGAAGYAPAPISVTDQALNHLRLGAPLVRPDTVVQSRSSGARFLVGSGQLLPLAPGAYETTPLRTLPIGPLDSASLLAMPWASPSLGLFARSTESGSTYLLNGSSRTQVLDAAAAGTAAATPVSPTVLNLFADAGSVGAPVLLKSADSPAVYRIEEGRRRSLPSWDDALRVSAASGGPRITTVDRRVLGALPAGPDQLGPGTLAYSTASASVYLIDGFGTKHHIGSWDRMANLGTGPLVLRREADLAAYTTAPGTPQNVVVCSGTSYLATGGRLHPVAPTVASHWATVPRTTLDATTCANLVRSGVAVGRFLRMPTGAIWYVENGTRRNITSYATYRALGGNDLDWVAVNTDAIATIPVGPDI